MQYFSCACDGIEVLRTEEKYTPTPMKTEQGWNGLYPVADDKMQEQMRMCTPQLVLKLRAKLYFR